MLNRVLITCATAGALALAPSAPAAAAGHTHHGVKHGGATHGQRHGSNHAGAHGSKHGKGHGSRDRLAGPRHAAGNVLRAQAARLNLMLAVFGSGDGLSAANQAALLEALHSDLGALSADLGQIADATNVHELNAIKHAAVLTVTIAVQQVTFTVEADAVEAQLADRGAVLNDLAVQVAMAADNGKPVGPAQAALEDAESRLAAAQSQVAAAVGTVLGLSPTASRAALNNAVDAADHALLEAQGALVAIDADIATINAVLAD